MRPPPKPSTSKKAYGNPPASLAIEGLEIPPALLQSLPEAQRDQLERMDGKPHVDRACVTQKDIAAGFTMFDKQSACTRVTLAASPRTYAANITCTGILAGTGTLNVEAPNPSRVQGTAMLQGMLGHVSLMLEAHWLSAGCDMPKK